MGKYLKTHTKKTAIDTLLKWRVHTCKTIHTPHTNANFGQYSIASMPCARLPGNGQRPFLKYFWLEHTERYLPWS